MTRVKKEARKETTKKASVSHETDRIRRVPDQKKIINNKHLNVSDINFKKLLDSVKTKSNKPAEAANGILQNNTIMTSNGSEVDVKEKLEELLERVEQVTSTGETIENEKKTTVESSFGAVETAEAAQNHLNVVFEVSQKEQKDEVWNQIELVGLSPESSQRNIVSSDHNINQENGGAFNDVSKNLTDSKDMNEVETDSEEEFDSSRVVDRLRKTEEGVDESVAYKFDDKSQTSESESESESNQSNRPRTASNDGSDENQIRECKGEEDDELVEILSDHSFTSEDDGEGSDNDKKGKSPTFCPKRTGFWDHDDRFDDISIEESREQNRNRKLWDKSEVERWGHDKYVESEQGPKEPWEVEQTIAELADRENKRSSGRERRRNFSDFIPDSNRSPGRGYNKQRRNDRTGIPSKNLFENQRKSYKNDRVSNKEEWPVPENEEPTTFAGHQGKLQRERPGKKQYNSKKGSFGDHELEETDSFTKTPNSVYREKHQEDRETQRKNGSNMSKRGHTKDNRRNNYRNPKDMDNQHVGRKTSTEDYSFERTDPVERKEHGKSGGRYSAEGRINKIKGVGRGNQKGKIEEHENQTKEKTNREKRIDQLPPRLREKAREKMENDGKANAPNTSLSSQEDQYEDIQESETFGNPPQMDGGSRDKPKRYSSQRQKTGTSLMDIPGQMHDEEEQMSQYLGMMHQTYDTQIHPLLQQQHAQQNQGMQNTNTVKMLQNQILLLQNQLQQQQLNIQSQAVPNMLQMSNIPLGHVLQQMQSGAGNQSSYSNSSLQFSDMNGRLMQNGNIGLSIPNPHINPVTLNQIMTATGVSQQQEQQQIPPHSVQGGDGLFVPPLLAPQQQQHQQFQRNESEQHQQVRRTRPGAIPIKPPPGL